MKVNILSNIRTHSVTRPGILISIDSGAVVDVVQDGETESGIPLYKVECGNGDYIHIYKYEFSPVEE